MLPRAASVRTLAEGPPHHPTLYGRLEGIGNGCLVHFPFRNLTVDHVVARKKGGTDHIDNLQLLCGACNSPQGHLVNGGADRRSTGRRASATATPTGAPAVEGPLGNREGSAARYPEDCQRPCRRPQTGRGMAGLHPLVTNGGNADPVGKYQDSPLRIRLGTPRVGTWHRCAGVDNMWGNRGNDTWLQRTT